MVLSNILLKDYSKCLKAISIRNAGIKIFLFAISLAISLKLLKGESSMIPFIKDYVSVLLGLLRNIFEFFRDYDLFFYDFVEFLLIAYIKVATEPMLLPHKTNSLIFLGYFKKTMIGSKYLWNVQMS